MTIDHRASAPLTDRQATRLQTLKGEGKALLALVDEFANEVAKALGHRPRVRVSYADGHPTGNYHMEAWESGACQKLNRNSEVRVFAEHDAAKLLDRCSFCTGW